MHEVFTHGASRRGEDCQKQETLIPRKCLLGRKYSLVAVGIIKTFELQLRSVVAMAEHNSNTTPYITTPTSHGVASSIVRHVQDR